MHTVAVIQARMGSTRLPGKVMLPLDGEYALTHVVDRVAASGVDETVVATSTEQADDIVTRYADRAGATVFRGSETDVLGRMYGAARAADADVVVRVTADDVLVAPAVIDACVAAIDEGADYAGNTIERTFPQGLIVEAFSMDSFETVEAESTENYQREHVTQYYLETPEQFALQNVVWRDAFDWPLPCARHEVRFALDEADDYELLRAVYEAVETDDRGLVPVRDAVEYVLDADIAGFNSHVAQTSVQGNE